MAAKQSRYPEEVLGALTAGIAIVALVAALVALRRADVVAAKARRWADGPRSKPSDAVAAESTTRTTQQGLSRVAVIRYDAFDDLGGQLSYSAALLDDIGNGIVITGIHGRAETRTYLKQIPQSGDSGASKLSPEEKQAVRDAMRGPRHG